jgi:LysM repeat protein
MTFLRNITALTTALTVLLPGVAAYARGGSSATSAAPREAADERAGTGEEDDGALFDAAASAALKLPNGQRWTPEDVGPSPEAAGAAIAGPQEMPSHGMRAAIREAAYTVKQGDTLRAIAYRYLMSPAAVAVVNNLPFDGQHDPLLKPGQVLRLPVLAGAPIGFKEGEQLISGPGISAMKTDDSNWGRPEMVQLLRTAFREMNKRWPQKHPVLIGSLSRPGGGRLGHHKSHRSGQDVDIGYLCNSANRDRWGNPAVNEIDWQRTWFVVDTLERSGQLAAIFMAPQLQRKLYEYAVAHGEPESRLEHLFQFGPKGSRGDTLIRNAAGHRDHFHVRFITARDMGGRDS